MWKVLLPSFKRFLFCSIPLITVQAHAHSQGMPLVLHGAEFSNHVEGLSNRIVSIPPAVCFHGQRTFTFFAQRCVSYL
jgi:hypothetical protein